MAYLIKLPKRTGDRDYSKIVIAPRDFTQEGIPEPPLCPPWIAKSLVAHLAKQPRIKSVAWFRGMVDEL